MNRAFWSAGILPELHMKNKYLLITLKFVGIAIMAFIMVSCGNEDHSVSITTRAYYACEGDIVIEIEKNASSISAGIFEGKELLMVRHLVRDSVSRELMYSTHDLSITLVGDGLEVSDSKRKISGCYLSESEMKRRGPRDTYYYISDIGALITTHNLDNDRINLTLEVGQNVLLDTILPHVRAASGAKFEQGDIMFWAKQNTAMLVYQGVLYGHCIVMFEDEMLDEPCSDTALHTGVMSFLNNALSDEIALTPEDDRQYIAERMDINEDGIEEIFVGLASPYFCGTGGCTWYLLNPDFTVLGKFSVSDFPIYISHELSNGYRDLYIKSNGKYHVLKFNNGYPTNPSLEPVFDLFSHPEYTTGGTERTLEWAYLRSCSF